MFSLKKFLYHGIAQKCDKIEVFKRLLFLCWIKTNSDNKNIQSCIWICINLDFVLLSLLSFRHQFQYKIFLVKYFINGRNGLNKEVLFKIYDEGKMKQRLLFFAKLLVFKSNASQFQFLFSVQNWFIQKCRGQELCR